MCLHTRDHVLMRVVPLGRSTSINLLHCHLHCCIGIRRSVFGDIFSIRGIDQKLFIKISKIKNSWNIKLLENFKDQRSPNPLTPTGFASA